MKKNIVKKGLLVFALVLPIASRMIMKWQRQEEYRKIDEAAEERRKEPKKDTEKVLKNEIKEGFIDAVSSNCELIGSYRCESSDQLHVSIIDEAGNIVADGISFINKVNDTHFIINGTNGNYILNTKEKSISQNYATIYEVGVRTTGGRVAGILYQTNEEPTIWSLLCKNQVYENITKVDEEILNKYISFEIKNGEIIHME